MQEYSGYLEYSSSESSMKEGCHLSSIRDHLGGNSHHRRAAEYILWLKKKKGKDLKWSKIACSVSQWGLTVVLLCLVCNSPFEFPVL